MNSPSYNFPSDFSTPKPNFYAADEPAINDEFTGQLSSLLLDITILGKEVEQLRNENLMLKAHIQVIEREKEKHIAKHAKNKFELEKALLQEKNLRKSAVKELNDFKAKYQIGFNKKSREKNEILMESSTEKVIKPKAKLNTNFKTKFYKLEQEHKELRKKIKDIETAALFGPNKSSILNYSHQST
jgi:hypothetical protein